jgi:uncharacterized protein (DUF433 family)
MDVRGLIVSDPEILGGKPVFRGTRVPVSIVFDNLADGVGLDEILREYPTLDRTDVLAVLKAAADRVIDAAA